MKQEIYDLHIDFIVANFPVVAEGFSLFFPGYMQIETDDFLIPLSGNQADNIAAADRPVIIGG